MSYDVPLQYNLAPLVFNAPSKLSVAIPSTVIPYRFLFVDADIVAVVVVVVVIVVILVVAVVPLPFGIFLVTNICILFFGFQIILSYFLAIPYDYWHY
jgi:sensor histidine kinase YesM